MVRYLNLFLYILLLVILYLFIFRIVVLILKDLRRERAGGHEPAGTPVRGRTPALVVTESDEPRHPPGQQIALDRVVYIGRGDENQVKLAASYASHRHARIILREGKYFLEDLGSTNGTYINGVRITEPVMLREGDLIRAAGVTLRFVRWEHEVE